MFSNIMPGKYMLLLPKLLNIRATVYYFCSNAPSGSWEFTKYRKKPKGGGRYLVNSKEVYDFNAWYLYCFIKMLLN